MNKLIEKICICTLMLSVSGSIITYKAKAVESTARKIITFNKNISDKNDKEDLMKKYGINKIKDLDLVNSVCVMLTKSQELKLKRDKSVISIEEDKLVKVLGKNKTSPPPAIPQPNQTLPWGISRIKADLVDSNQLSANVKVAVIDSGIDLTHPDLAANIKGGYNAINSKTSINDDYGHGTHVAGIIAAANNSIGVVGVNPIASLYGIKVIDNTGNGYLSNLIEGIEWSIKNNMQVINMSLSVGDSSALHDAIIRANQAGIVLVAAAGNKEYDPVSYPAAYPEVISVAATDYNDNKSMQSPKGKIDISAPGVDIHSTNMGGGYSTLTGTSMAASHVTGVVTFIISQPSKYDLNGDSKLSPSEVMVRLQTTAKDLGSIGIDDVYGAGLVDAYNAVTQ